MSCDPKLLKVLEDNPDLAGMGWKTHAAYLGKKSQEDNIKEFLADRDRLLEGMINDEFQRTYTFINIATTRLTRVNPRLTSYGWKHRCEEWWSNQTKDSGTYVRNGIFIAAAIALDVPHKRIEKSPNSKFALSTKLTRETIF